MRYQARWSNGFWKTFDSERFVDVETHPTQKIANEVVAILNTTLEVRRRLTGVIR